MKLLTMQVIVRSGEYPQLTEIILLITSSLRTSSSDYDLGPEPTKSRKGTSKWWFDYFHPCSILYFFRDLNLTLERRIACSSRLPVGALELRALAPLVSFAKHECYRCGQPIAFLTPASAKSSDPLSTSQSGYSQNGRDQYFWVLSLLHNNTRHISKPGSLIFRRCPIIGISCTQLISVIY